MPARSDAPASGAEPTLTTGAPGPGLEAWVRVALVALAAAAAIYRDADPNTWFHLAAGRSIFSHGLPTQEIWCLAAKGQAPRLGGWPFDVALYGAHRIAGDLGVALWRAAWTAGAAALALSLLTLLGAASWTAVLIAPLVIAASRDRLGPRPDQIALVLALFALFLLERARRGDRDRARWLVPAQALWANLHASWFLGPAIAWIYAGAEWWNGSPKARIWAVLGLGLCAASVLTPAPLEMLTAPLRLAAAAKAGGLVASIEGMRHWTWSRDRNDPFTALALAWVLAALIGGRRVWRASPGLAAVSIGAMVLGFLGERFRDLAAWVAFAPLALALRPSRPTWISRLRALPALAAGLAGLAWLVASPRFAPGIEPVRRWLPVGAVALADSAAIEGPVLNVPEHGGYILWARGDAHPPLVDLRMRGDQAFHETFARAQTDPLALDLLLEERHFTHAILPVPRSVSDRMATNLARRLEWALVYYDDAGCLFVRWSEHPELAGRAYRYLTPDYLAMIEMMVRSRADSGLGRLLTAELERARATSPFHARADLWLGQLALAGRREAEAIRYLDEAEGIAPDTPGLAVNQGRAYDMAGDPAKARAAYRRALAIPDDAEEAREMLNLFDRSPP